MTRAVRDRRASGADGRDNERLADTGEAALRSYALGGGRSGALPDDAGMSTASSETRPEGSCVAKAPTNAAAASAVTHDPAARQEPEAGPGQRAFCCGVASLEDAVPVPVDGATPCSSVASRGDTAEPRPVIAAMLGSPSDSIAAPAIGAIPGTTHTAPTATMLRCPANRASKRPANRRKRISTSSQSSKRTDEVKEDSTHL